MRHSAAILCHDKTSLHALKASLEELGIEPVACHSRHEALKLVTAGRCSTLIVDFDLPDAEQVISMAALLPPAQKPVLLAVASRVWPGTGQAFQSGASRILYRPLDKEQITDALRSSRKPANTTRRKAPRYELKTVVYLDVDGGGTISGISIDIGEHGLAMQATEPVPMSSNLAFHCVLPGTDISLDGHADVIWASDQGRAGLFFTKLSPAARKHLKQWLGKRHAHSGNKHQKEDHPAHELLPPVDGHVSFAATE
jgi:ActR/RegA family two-component response regulator